MPFTPPSKEAIAQWIKNNPHQASKHHIARAFGIKGQGRIALKRILSKLKEEGICVKKTKNMINANLPAVGVLRVCDIDDGGNMFACLPNKTQERVFIHTPTHINAPEIGARILVKIKKMAQGDIAHEGRIIRILPQETRVSGIFYPTKKGGEIHPIYRVKNKIWVVDASYVGQAKKGDIVHGELTRKRRDGHPEARIVAIKSSIGSDIAKGLSEIAVKIHDLEDSFSPKELGEAKSVTMPVKEGYRDLCDLPFITIDPADARDHDDAIYAKSDPHNAGGHILWVAIADVAAFVQAGGTLDKVARKRANSVYLPDRVLPMLPETLSNGLCSLNEQEIRPVIAARLTISADGCVTHHEFTRALIRVRKALSYEELQAAQDGLPNARTEALVKPIIAPLFAAYKTVLQRDKVAASLDLDLPEQKIYLNAEGGVNMIELAVRLDAHRLVEKFMILANVAAAQTLVAHKMPLIFRTHPTPKTDRLKTFSQTVNALGLAFKNSNIPTPHIFNTLLKKAAICGKKKSISLCVLRAQAQALYSAKNAGHFGLNLPIYTHFTSPIRRYSDLVIHRALIVAHGWKIGKNEAKLLRKFVFNMDELEKISVHINKTERRAMEAERQTNERFVAFYLKDYIDERFKAHISGVTRFGIFVKLDNIGAEGLVPLSALKGDYFDFNEKMLCLNGRNSAVQFVLGMALDVRLKEVFPLTGGLVFAVEAIEGKNLEHIFKHMKKPHERDFFSHKSYKKGRTYKKRSK